jgi:hypothetical protein
VRNWVRENKDYLPKDFTSNRLNRVEAIRQVGQLNADARKEQGRKTISPAEREQYYQKNNAKYPALNANHQPIKENENRQQYINTVEPERQPPVRIPKPSQQSTVIPRQEVRQENQQERKPPENNFNNINRAQEYHRNTWESTQPVSRPQAPSYSQPTQRSQPQPQPIQRSQPPPQPVRQVAPSNPPPSQRRK